eukprot:Anaeramoba_flamelloidesa571782_42.p1 GENE.a571782_42~~a571782_42.p1  ORF type:complete len:326 (+),score=79.53 a571782_42:1029-2006(+)
MLNYLDGWKKQDREQILLRFPNTKLAKKYEKQIIRGHKGSKNFAMNGVANFQCSICDSSLNSFREGEMHLSKNKIVLQLSHLKTPLFAKKLNSRYLISLHKKDTHIFCIELILSQKKQKQYMIRFKKKENTLLCMMTLILFIQNNNIGINPTDKNEVKLSKLSGIVLPPLVAPNEKFKKLLQTVDTINMRSKPTEIFKKFYDQSGVNFLAAIVSSKKYPLRAGYIKVRKNGFKVGVKSSITFSVHFKNNPLVFKCPEDENMFMIKWTEDAMCRASSDNTITLYCERKSERSLITRSIVYFNHKWLKLQRQKRKNKKRSKNDKKRK